MPGFTKKEPKDGTIIESNKMNLRWETKCYSSTLESSSSVKENCATNGWDRTPSSTHRHTTQSPSRMMMVTYLEPTINV